MLDDSTYQAPHDMNQPERAPLISVVIPVYNEEKVLPELLRRLTNLFDGQPSTVWQAVLVDDGSKDQSARIISNYGNVDPRITLLELSRNFGFQAALAAGVAHAQGDAVITMDADLQDPPEHIPEMVALWRNGAEIVCARRLSRQETGFRRLGMDLFHYVFSFIVDHPIQRNIGTFGLMDRMAVQALVQLQEKHRFFPGLRAWVGFRVAEVFYNRRERAAGTPGQTIAKLAKYALDGVFSFSYLPLRLLTYVGLTIGAAGFILGIYYAIKRLFNIETAPTGFTTLAVLILFLGGIQLVGFGIIGEYLARVYDETKQRPLYVLRKRIDSLHPRQAAQFSPASKNDGFA